MESSQAVIEEVVGDGYIRSRIENRQVMSSFTSKHVFKIVKWKYFSSFAVYTGE